MPTILLLMLAKPALAFLSRPRYDTDMKKLIQTYAMLIKYGVFGVLTTAINLAAYALFYHAFHWGNVASTVLAWVLSVLFAFVTNKLWVFDSKSLAPKILLREFWAFVSCRLATGALDLAIMYVGVDLLALPAMPLKIASNILVIVLNYVFSKVLIFTKRS